LWNKKNLLYYYLIGAFLNTIVNITLKGYIQQPRPSDNEKLFKIAFKNVKSTIFKQGTPYDIFGMPSGHAQSCFYSTFFILFALKNRYIFTIYLFFSLLITFQRICFSYHTVFQMFVGCAVGSIIAYLIYYMAQKKIIGKLVPRKEDNGPL
jgi:membrane-associated phospholipid phosphatase